MIIAILVLLTLVAAGVWYVRQKQADDAPDRSRALPVLPHAAVQIRCGKNACARARAMVGMKILARDAPPLPLTHCSMRNCQCAYRKFGDRRQEHRRSMDDGIEPLIYDGKELRRGGERRLG